MGLSWISQKLLTLDHHDLLIAKLHSHGFLIPEVLSNPTSRTYGKGRKLKLRIVHGQN